jgi:hypothetical protein
MIYKCERCGFSTQRKGNLKNHLTRKFLCEPTLENVSISFLLKKLEKEIEKKHFCNKCEKAFSHQPGLSRHRQTCNPNSILNKLKQIESELSLLKQTKNINTNYCKKQKTNRPTEDIPVSEQSVSPNKFVYLMQSSRHKNYFKIGRATNVEEREKELQMRNCKTYNTYQLKTIRKFNVKNNINCERKLHECFSQFRICVRNGDSADTELFEITTIPHDQFIKQFEEKVKKFCNS